mgnify:CR=1 FL=1
MSVRVTLEMFWRSSHDLFEHLGEMILVKKPEAVGDGFDGLVAVLQHLAGTLHFHGCIEIQRRLHGFLLKKRAIVRNGKSCCFSQHFQRHAAVNILPHKFDALNDAVFFRMFP